MRFATAINFIQYYAFSRKPHVSFDFLTAIRMYNMYSLSVCLYFRSHLFTHSLSFAFAHSTLLYTLSRCCFEKKKSKKSKIKERRTMKKHKQQTLS